MKSENNLQEDTNVFLNSIASNNKYLLMKIMEQFNDFNSTQVNTALLLKLNYTTNEIETILDIPVTSINATNNLLNNSQHIEFLLLSVI